MIKIFQRIGSIVFFSLPNLIRGKIKGSKYAYQKESDMELPTYEEVQLILLWVLPLTKHMSVLLSTLPITRLLKM